MTLNRSTIFAELRKRGITKVVVSFSGGNDEGGADGVVGHTADGTEVVFDEPGVYTNWQDQGKYLVGWGENARPATEEELKQQQLLDVLEAPIYAEYGSFAGDFSVYGTLTWDVEAGTVIMSKEEQSGYDHSEYPV